MSYQVKRQPGNGQTRRTMQTPEERSAGGRRNLRSGQFSIQRHFATSSAWVLTAGSWPTSITTIRSANVTVKKRWATTSNHRVDTMSDRKSAFAVGRSSSPDAPTDSFLVVVHPEACSSRRSWCQSSTTRTRPRRSGPYPRRADGPSSRRPFPRGSRSTMLPTRCNRHLGHPCASILISQGPTRRRSRAGSLMHR
jgi:hypothetical protein